MSECVPSATERNCLTHDKPFGTCGRPTAQAIAALAIAKCTHTAPQEMTGDQDGACAGCIVEAIEGTR